MSTSPPKGDKTADVSSGPLGAITGREQMQNLRDPNLFDYLVGDREHARRKLAARWMGAITLSLR
jgi:hypothetical protein